MQTHEQSSKILPEQIRNIISGEVSQFPHKLRPNTGFGAPKTVQPSPHNMILSINKGLEEQSKYVSIGHQKSYKSLYQNHNSF